MLIHTPRGCLCRDALTPRRNRALLLVFAVVTFPSVARAAQEPGMTVLLSLDKTERIDETYSRQGAKRFMTTATGEGNTVDGNGATHFGATTAAVAEGNQYFGIMVPLSEPVDLSQRRLVFHARTNHTGNTAAFYIRAYNKGENKPAWSFNSWNASLTGRWREFCVQPGLSFGGLTWEPRVVEDRVATAVDRIEFIIS
jgi:hypothetical protein